MRGHPDSIVDLTFSTDGRRLVRVSANCTTWLWDAQRGAPVACLYHSDSVVLMGGALPNGVFADGERVVSLTLHAAWDASTGGVIRGPNRDRSILGRSIVWAPDGRRFAVFSHGAEVVVCTLDHPDERVVLAGHAGEVTGVAFSPGGRQLVSASADGTAHVWDTHTGAQTALLQGHQAAVTCVAFAPDGRQVVSGGADGTVRIWEVQGGRELACLRIADPGVWCKLWSSDGTTTEVHAVRAVAFSQTQAHVLTLSDSDRVRVWAPASGACLETIRGRVDLRALAAGVPWRAVVREGQVQVEAAGGAVAWMPLPRGLGGAGALVTHPGGRTWAYAVGNYLYLFTLEA